MLRLCFINTSVFDSKIKKEPFTQKICKLFKHGHRHLYIQNMSVNKYVSLQYVSLQYVNLKYVSLKHVSLKYVSLKYVSLKYVNLKYVSLK